MSRYATAYLRETVAQQLSKIMGVQRILVTGLAVFTDHQQLIQFPKNSGFFFGIGAEICLCIRKFLVRPFSGPVAVELTCSLLTILWSLRIKKEHLYG